MKMNKKIVFSLLILVIVIVRMSSISFAERVPLHPIFKFDISHPNVEMDHDTKSYKFYWDDRRFWTIIKVPDIIIIANVEFELSTKRYKYTYQIVNNKSQEQPLPGVCIECNTIVITSSGGNPIKNWEKPQWQLGYIEFPQIDYLSCVKLKNSVSSFIETQGDLPGIVECSADFICSDTGLLGSDMETSEYCIEKYGQYYDLDKIYEIEGIKVQGRPDYIPIVAGWVTGKTIGPVGLPEKFNPQLFIGTLTSYLTESYSLGWVESDKVLNNLKEKLSKVKSAIDEGRKLEARKILKTFVKKIEAEKGKTLLSEAYGLLKYNALYLIEQLNSTQMRAPSMLIPIPSGEFNAKAALENLQRFVEQCVVLGWIKKYRLCSEKSPFWWHSRLHVLLCMAHDSLSQKKDNISAMQHIETFIAELESEKGNHINRKAYSLLKEYARYILNNL